MQAIIVEMISSTVSAFPSSVYAPVYWLQPAMPAASASVN
jgi:hypothetical protein